MESLSFPPGHSGQSYDAFRSVRSDISMANAARFPQKAPDAQQYIQIQPQADKFHPVSDALMPFSPNAIQFDQAFPSGFEEKFKMSGVTIDPPAMKATLLFINQQISDLLAGAVQISKWRASSVLSPGSAVTLVPMISQDLIFTEHEQISNDRKGILDTNIPQMSVIPNLNVDTCSSTSISREDQIHL